VPIVKLELRSQRGATLLELMVTVMIAGIVLAIGVPQMGNWIRRHSVISAAEIFQNGLRRAETEAIRRNTPTEFLLTNGTPSSSASLTATANGSNWAIRLLDSTYNVVTDGYVAGFKLSEVSTEVTIGGPASVVFNGMGRALDSTGGAISTYQIYRFSRSGADKAYCVFVTPGGGVKLCDPGLPSGNPRACQPMLTLAQCPSV